MPFVFILGATNNGITIYIFSNIVTTRPHIPLQASLLLKSILDSNQHLQQNFPSLWLLTGLFISNMNNSQHTDLYNKFSSTTMQSQQHLKKHKIGPKKDMTNNRQPSPIKLETKSGYIWTKRGSKGSTINFFPSDMGLIQFWKKSEKMLIDWTFLHSWEYMM